MSYRSACDLALAKPSEASGVYLFPVIPTKVAKQPRGVYPKGFPVILEPTDDRTPKKKQNHPSFLKRRKIFFTSLYLHSALHIINKPLHKRMLFRRFHRHKKAHHVRIIGGKQGAGMR